MKSVMVILPGRAALGSRQWEARKTIMDLREKREKEKHGLDCDVFPRAPSGDLLASHHK